jgi:GH15 family glucan-1,4-alpha-glucosidase
MEAIKPWFRPLIISAVEFLVHFRERDSGPPKPSWDLWEEKRCVYAYTMATVWAGLMAAVNFADLFGELADTAEFRRAAQEVKRAYERYLYDEAEGQFLNRISIKIDGSVEQDFTVDASLHGLWYFGMFEPTDPRIVRTMQAVEEQLWCQTPFRRIARYVRGRVQLGPR